MSQDIPTQETNVTSNETTLVKGGQQGMQDADHFDGFNRVAPMKYYVIGRGRYRPFEMGPSDTVDFRNVLPLSATDMYYGLLQYLGPDAFEAFKQLITTQQNTSNEDALAIFIANMWAPTVIALLESHTSLRSDGHTLQLTTGGYFCYDVKLSKYMPKKLNTDLDYNNDITLTRATKLLRIIRARLNALPISLTQLLFAGPPEGPFGPYAGLLDPTATYPENSTDEPFANAINEDFDWYPTFRQNLQYAYYMFAPGAAEPYAFMYIVVREDEQDIVAYRNSTVFRALSENEGASYVDYTNTLFGPEAILQAGSKDIAGGATKKRKKTLDKESMYETTKGNSKTNRFGTKEDIDGLQWYIEGDAALGLIMPDGSDVPLVKAHMYGESMGPLLKKMPYKSIFVWFPPLEEGRSDGYYKGNTPDYASMSPWAHAYDVRPLWDLGSMDEAPEERNLRTVWKLLKSLDEGYSEDPEDYGLRGGFITEIMLN